MREQLSFVPLGASVSAAASAAPARSRVTSAFRPAVLDAPQVDLAVRESSRATGFAAGFAAGAREAAATASVEAARVAADRAAADVAASAALTHALDVLAAAASAARARTAPVLEQAEALLHAGALELARAVLGTELADAERSATAALARVLDRAPEAQTVTVHLHPRDLDALRAAGAGPLPDGVELVADAALAPGDAVARHADGYLDARIGAALDRAAAALAQDVA